MRYTILILLLFNLSLKAFPKSEDRIKIAIVDTGISRDFNKEYLCTEGHRDFSITAESDFTLLVDNNGHGTNVASIIARNLDTSKYCLLIVKYFDGRYDRSPERSTLKSFSYLRFVDNVRYINYSSVGTSEVDNEENLLRLLLDKGIRITAAAGNDNKDLSQYCGYFPACYDLEGRFYVVGSSTGHYSNYNGPVAIKEDGTKVCGGGICLTGTSQAAAVFMNKLIIKESENEKPNQCVVNLNTGKHSCY